MWNGGKGSVQSGLPWAREVDANMSTNNRAAAIATDIFLYRIGRVVLLTAAAKTVDDREYRTKQWTTEVRKIGTRDINRTGVYEK
jgi:hypothetical protein